MTSTPTTRLTTTVRGSSTRGVSLRSRPIRPKTSVMATASSDAEPHTDGRPDEADHTRLEQHRPGHLPPAGADGPQQGQLAAALGHEDGEGVDDEEGPDGQRDPREDEQERRDERQRLVDPAGGTRRRGVAGRGLGVGGEHRRDRAAQLLLGGALRRGHPDLREGVLALEEQLLRLGGVEHDDAGPHQRRPAERGGADEADVEARLLGGRHQRDGLPDEVAGLLRGAGVEDDLTLRLRPASALEGRHGYAVGGGAPE